ncbi:ATP-binding protein [Pseudomonas fluorescens]|uniref:ATP-dependent zinc metalloprotease FtsH n=1 Tax=Pseudomonas fluorescens TaxID=294 RepID=A0A5E7B3P1_PSEFL|nr:ATP-binding protein [Pseudomonas fluorescens]VVN83537.1 ATP-dependent zinc metalloprotease FtsH [Pseudomonas fluorescens]
MSQRRDFAENRRVLTQALNAFAAYLTARLAGEPAPLGAYLETPPALALLSERLGLSRFEQDLLLLAAAVDLDPRFRDLLAQAQGDANQPWLSFELALRLLPEPEWSAITPIGRLRRWQLLEPCGSGGVLQARLVVDEIILHRIAGLSFPDPRLEPWFRQENLADAASVAIDRHQARASILEIATQWQAAPSLALAPIARLVDGDGEGYAQALATELGLKLYRMAEHELPVGQAEREQLAHLWEREALLHGVLLWLHPHSLNPEQAQRLGDFLDHLQSLLLLSGDSAPTLRRRQCRVSVQGSDASARLTLWQQQLGESVAGVNGRLGLLAEQFQLSSSTILRLAEGFKARPQGGAEHLWQVCREEARRGLEHLAERVDARAGWDDLVLPDAALTSLHTLAAQVRQRTRVYRDWGFAERSDRGLGISALFAGGSGTGKTLAAEVLANELRLDLYRIDLAALVSKYIGETEKNLSRVFAAAESSGAILLFDEADALFGKRSEVRDSHDRYANLEVSYLLQRIETYRGLAILTTNLKQAIDPAFQRRIRFIVQFPFPDVQARSAIWQRAFPPDAPCSALDIGKLARLSLSGGHIRNLALNAAFLAADKDMAIGMQHLRAAAEAEFVKLEKPLPAAEVGDWE